MFEDGRVVSALDGLIHYAAIFYWLIVFVVLSLVFRAGNAYLAIRKIEHAAADLRYALPYDLTLAELEKQKRRQLLITLCALAALTLLLLFGHSLFY